MAKVSQDTMPRQKFTAWLLLSAIVIVIDLLTKYWVQSTLVYAEQRSLTAFFDLVLFHNQGAAFSFLAGAGGWQRVFFSAIALTASAVIIYMLRKHPGQKLFCFGLSLILGGALGNLYDRLTLGYVVDFLYFHYQQHYWPAFNVADSAITCGVILLLWDSFRKPQQ
jgi:signal peptidase II